MASTIEHERDQTRDISALNDSIYPCYELRPGANLWTKQWLERFLALLLLIPGLPLIGTLFLLVRLTSPGPGIYRQSRVGKDGETFEIFKLRTMTDNAEAETGPTWALQNDPRLTLLGRVLRNLHLDELPQLLNVVRGEMAMIGPRPERPEIVRVLVQEIPGYADRLSVYPGITGLAQVNLPPDTDLESVRRKLKLDRAYIQQMGLGLDTRIFVCTFLHFVGLPGPWARYLVRLNRVALLDGETSSKHHVPGASDADHAVDDTICFAPDDTQIGIKSRDVDLAKYGRKPR